MSKRARYDDGSAARRASSGSSDNDGEEGLNEYEEEDEEEVFDPPPPGTRARYLYDTSRHVQAMLPATLPPGIRNTVLRKIPNKAKASSRGMSAQAYQRAQLAQSQMPGVEQLNLSNEPDAMLNHLLAVEDDASGLRGHIMREMQERAALRHARAQALALSDRFPPEVVREYVAPFFRGYYGPGDAASPPGKGAAGSGGPGGGGPGVKRMGSGARKLTQKRGRRK